MTLTIAIDGPVGAGKSSMARGLAKALRIPYLDTGAMYRALGLKALRLGLDPQDGPAMEALCADTDIRVELSSGRQRTFLDGEEVTDLIRTQPVSDAASALSKAAGVRARMAALQRQYAMQADAVVLDGRDIGTRVLPDASFKFFLMASPETRAMRRHMENLERGLPSAYEQVLADLVARDRQDSERAVDPLRPAADAILVDTTALDEAAVLDKLLGIVRGDGA